MNDTSEEWLAEAFQRLGDARSLLRRERQARAVSAAYYAVHAAGKGALMKVEVAELSSHNALYKMLAYHFIRPGALPGDTAGFIQDLYDERAAADYDLRRYGTPEAQAWLDDAEALIDRLATL